jgi:DNA-binding MarR family transcriptional regulator
MSEALEQRIAAVRAFNRFYTQKIGVLAEGLLSSAFSLTEARVLYELAHRDGLTAGQLGRELGLDAGYLSRILSAFARQGLIEKSPSSVDRRQTLLALTEGGRNAFAPLDRRSHDDIKAALSALPATKQARLAAAMGCVQQLLGDALAPEPVELRAHRPGDMGWVTSRHGELYAEEYG